MADTKTSAEPVTATTLAATDLIRTSQDLGGGTFGNAKMTGASLVSQMAAAAPVQSVNTKTGAVTLAASDVGAVPTTTTVNGHALSSNVTITASDVSALPTGTTTASVPDSTNKRYVTDAELAVLAVTSGTNTGDQTITLTGDVTGSGTGTFAATIGANKVANAKLDQMGANTIKGNNTGATANAADLSVAQATAMLSLFTSSLQGLVPGSGGGTANFLRADGTWAAPAGGGGGSPGGSVGQLQWNNTTFAGTSLLTTNGTNLLSALPTTDPLVSSALWMENGNVTESSSSSGFPAGAVAASSLIGWGAVAPGISGSLVQTGVPVSTFGTSSLITAASTNWTLRQVQSSYASAASAGSTSGFCGANIFMTTSSTAGMGGAYIDIIGAIGTNTTGHQFFMGVRDTAAAISADPSSLVNLVGVGFDAADASTGNWVLFNNAGSGTATRTSMSFARTTVNSIRLRLYNPPASLTWFYELYNMNTSITTPANSGTISTNTPVSGSILTPIITGRTGALTSAISVRVTAACYKWNRT